MAISKKGGLNDEKDFDNVFCVCVRGLFFI
jgi:hypothetical protein